MSRVLRALIRREHVVLPELSVVEDRFITVEVLPRYSTMEDAGNKDVEEAVSAPFTETVSVSHVVTECSD